MLKIPALSLFFVLFLAGCATIDTAKDRASQSGRAAVDEANGLALWQLCEGTTRGGYQRMCAGKDMMCDAMDAMCAERPQTWRAVKE